MLARLRFRWGIASFLTMSIVAVIAMLMVTTTLLDIRRARSLARQELEQRGLLMVSTFNDVLADPIYFTDMDGLGDIANLVNVQPDLLYVQVYSPDGRLLVDAGQQGRNAVGVVDNEFGLRAVQDREAAFRHNGHALEVAAPIEIGDDVLGAVQFGLDSEPVEAEIRAITIRRVWEAVALMFAGVFISFLIAEYFVRPIRRLVGVTRKVAEGEFDFSARGKRSNEFGDLAVAFEEMTGALRESRARLEERTSEFADANEQLLSEIAERKQAEEALRETHGELEIRVEERTAEVVRTNEIMKEEMGERESLKAQFLQAQKMEAIGQMAGGVAHDFNNLLTGIVGYSQLGMMEGCSRDRLGGYLQEIQKAAERASHLTRQLLTFSRRQVVEPRVLSINDLFLDLDKMLRRLIGEDIELVTLPAPVLGTVKVDPGQMEQVLVNMAVNARDAMPDGGKLIIQTANVTVDDEYARGRLDLTPGEYVMMSVSDNGVGMDQEVKAHIFEPFFTTKEVGKGTGLGLSTCYGIVAQSGGRITVDSEPGKGTIFEIYLPRVEDITGYLALSDTTEHLPVGSETVLLVEDEPLVRAVISQVLREQGYTVLEAANGHEAMSVAQHHSDEEIHLLLTDVVMPLMGGRELTKQLGRLHPEARVLYTSGYTDDVILNRGVLNLGAEFMQKPFTPDVLARTVRDVLEK